jgi:arylformamidase
MNTTSTSRSTPAGLFRGMNRAALDAAYDNVAHVGQAKRDACVAGWWKRANAMRASSTACLDLRYGDGPRHRLDVFPCGRSGAPTLAYVHGGYWQWNDKERDAFIAEGVCAAGFNFALLEYTLAPAVRIDEIVREIRTAVAWVIDHSGDWGGDAERVFVGGHSAGGHLAAMAITEPRVAGGVAISGIFDLEPIRLGRLNDNLGLDEATSDRNSPIRHLPASSRPLVVAVGLGELPELVRQSEEFAKAWNQQGLPGSYLALEGKDHFSILEELARGDGAILRALKDLAKRA